MLSSTPTRQPGEDFRRKVATHWGATYAELEALALGEESPSSSSGSWKTEGMPPNLELAASEYVWMPELPHELRAVVREQARQHYVYSHADFPREVWQRVLTGLEREALALRARATSDDDPRLPRKRRVRT